MKNKRQFQGWRSEQIAKVFLLNSGLFDIVENFSSNSDEKADFIAVYKEMDDKRFEVEVKATKYSKHEIQRKYAKKNGHSPNALVIEFYVNYDEETGYFRLANGNYSSELSNMSRDKFISEVENYAVKIVRH